MNYLVHLCLLSSKGGCLLSIALTESEGTSRLHSQASGNHAFSMINQDATLHKYTLGYILAGQLYVEGHI